MSPENLGLNISQAKNVFPFKLARKVFRIAAEEKAAFQYEPYDSDASMS